MTKFLRLLLDPYLGLVLAMLALGLLWNQSPTGLLVLKWCATIMVALLFFAYGLRLHTKEVIAGLTNIKLQGAILGSTFLIFPLLGFALYSLTGAFLGAFASGVFYLTLLPSTVQSSVAFTSIARGNVAGAITAATTSNLLGMFITPLLTMLLLGSQGTMSFGKMRTILFEILVPFIVGQLLSPYWGDKLRTHKKFIYTLDRSTILVVIWSAVSTATALGVWQTVTGSMVFYLFIVDLFLILLMLMFTWNFGRLLQLDYPSKVALIMCGSKKSLTTGLPMALALFGGTNLATMVVPVIIFHQTQIIACTLIAQHLASKAENA